MISYFKQDDLRRSGKKTPKRDIYDLVAETGLYSIGTSFIVKELPFTWLVNEYVSSKIYRLILGDALIADTVLFHSPNKRKKPKFVCRGDVKLAVKMFEPGTFNDVSNEGVPFECLINTCKQKYSGYILAHLTSLLLAENDACSGTNFGVVKLRDNSNITRFDMDESLSFLIQTGVSKIEYCFIEDSEEYKLLKKIGQLKSFVDQVKKATPPKKSHISWHSIYSSICPSKGEFLPEGITCAGIKIMPFDKQLSLEVLEILSNLKPEEVKNATRKAVGELTDLLGTNLFEKNYNFTRISELKSQPSVQDFDSFIQVNMRLLRFESDAQKHQYIESLNGQGTEQSRDKVEEFSDFVFDNIAQNFISLMDTYVCLQVQVALETNNLQLLYKAAHQKRNWEKFDSDSLSFPALGGLYEETYSEFFPNMLCTTPDVASRYKTFEALCTEFAQKFDNQVSQQLHNLCLGSTASEGEL